MRQGATRQGAAAETLLSGGAVLAVLAGLSGELARVGVSGRALLALGYLIVFGSLLACTAYA